MGATCTSSNSRPDFDHDRATNRGSSCVQALDENKNESSSLVYALLIQQLIEHRVRDLLRQREAHGEVVNPVATKDTASQAEAVGIKNTVGGAGAPIDFSPLDTLTASLECKMAAVLANSTSNPTSSRERPADDHHVAIVTGDRDNRNNNTMSNNISPRSCDFPALDDYSRASSFQTPHNNNIQVRGNDGLGIIHRGASPCRAPVEHRDKSPTMSNGTAQSKKGSVSAPKARPKVPPRAKPLPSSSPASTLSPATGALLGGAKKTKEGSRSARENHLKFAERFEIGKDYLDQLRKLIHAADDDDDNDMRSGDVNNRYTNNNLYAAGKGSDWWGKGSTAEPIRTNTVCLDPELLAQDAVRGGAGGVGRLGVSGVGYVATDGAASDRPLWGSGAAGGLLLTQTMSGDFAAAAAQHNNNNGNNSSVFSPLESFNGGVTATMPFSPLSARGRSPTIVGGSPATNALLAVGSTSGGGGGMMEETNHAPPPALQLMAMSRSTCRMGNESNFLPHCVPPEQTGGAPAESIVGAAERERGGEAAFTEQMTFTPSASVQLLKRIQQQKERSMLQRSTNGAASATSPAADWLGFSGLMPNNDTVSAGAGVLLDNGPNANQKSPAHEPINLDGMQPFGMSRDTEGQQDVGQHSSSPSIPLAGSLAAFKEAKARAKALLEGQHASSGTYSNTNLKRSGCVDNADKSDEGGVDDAGQPLRLALASIRRVSSSFSHPLLNAVTATSSDKPSASSFSLAPTARFVTTAAAQPTDVTKVKTRNGSATASESARRPPSEPSITRAEIPPFDRIGNIEHRISVPSTIVVVSPYPPPPPQLGVKAISDDGSEPKKCGERNVKIAENPMPTSAQANPTAVDDNTDAVTLTLTRAELTVLVSALRLLKK